ncbi:MAG: hypothetical protein GXP35_15470 [Actinobacteria bacterium]|nr:hypothetical protein [Actinomycetota bacterium]
MRLLIAATALLLASCSSGDETAADSGPTSSPVTEVGAATSVDTTIRAVLRVPLSLYRVASSDESVFGSSSRTEDELRSIADKMNTIWAQADVVFDPVRVETIVVPAELLTGIDQLDPDDFLRAAGREFDIPEPGVINGFYVASAGRVNGFAPSSQRVFFVVDEPGVNDERVSSHEIGHILGLHHDLDDADRLLFSGTNGEALTPEEQTVARYFARGYLIGVGLAPVVLEIPNVGDGSLEGHTPRGFAGSGTGLFAGDNLNENFPNDDGVQIFLAFELPSQLPPFESVSLVSDALNVQGDPFGTLGTLRAAPVSFDNFSPPVFETEPTGPTSACTVGSDGRFRCDVTEAASSAIAADDSHIQIRVRFDEVGNGDGEQDLAMFFLTNSNTNEPGIFRLIFD